MPSVLSCWSTKREEIKWRPCQHVGIKFNGENSKGHLHSVSITSAVFFKFFHICQKTPVSNQVIFLILLVMINLVRTHGILNSIIKKYILIKGLQIITSINTVYFILSNLTQYWNTKYITDKDFRVNSLIRTNIYTYYILIIITEK